MKELNKIGDYMADLIILFTSIGLLCYGKIEAGILSLILLQIRTDNRKK